MIYSSRLFASFVLVVSLGLHSVIGYVFTPNAKIDLEGGMETPTVALGNSFQDVAQGVLEAFEPKPSLPPEVAQTATLAPAKPRQTAAPTDLKPAIVQTIPALKPTLNTIPIAKTVALESVKSTPSEIAKPTKTVKPSPLAQPKPEVMEAEVAETTPKPRPVKRPVQTPKETPTKKPPAPKGQQQPKQVTGQTTGQKAAKSTTQSNAKSATSQKAGNAARSNYAGKINRKITRVRRPKTRDVGTVKVTFKIAPNGQLAAARVSKSSGNAALDKAALDLIRRAAPFPKPPFGINLTFSKTFKFGK